MSYRRQAYTPLKASDFTVINQTTTTIYDGYGGIELVRAKRTADSLTLLVKTAPTPPYSITMHAYNPYDGTSGSFIGFVLKNTGADNIVTAGEWHAKYNPSRIVNKWSKYDTFVADYTITGDIAPYSEDRWMRLVDDNTNRMFYISRDGVNWTLIHSVGRTDYITPNQIGIAFEPGTTNTACITVDSWKVDYQG